MPRARLAALFVGLSLLTRGPFLAADFLNVDEAAHIVGSWELLRGRLLYTDFADHKPPLVYVWYALAQALFGRGMLAVRVLTSFLAVPLTAFGASAFFGHDRRGAAAGVLLLLYGVAYTGHDMLAVNAELLMVLPATWALVALGGREAAARPARALAAGLLLGVASLFKAPAALWLPAFALAVVAAGGMPRAARAVRTAALAGGFLLPLAAAAAVFHAVGGLEGFLYWNLTHNLLYAANPIRAVEAAGRAGRFFLPFLVVTAPLWWAAWRARDRLDAHRRLLLASTLAFSVAAAAVGWRFFPHYFVQILPPLAIAAAPWAAAACRRPWPRPARAFAGFSVGAAALFTAANAYLFLVRQDLYEETRPVFREVANRLRADPCFGGANLFVWGFAPIFYYYAELPPASRFVMPPPTLTGYVPGNVGSYTGQVAAEGLVRPEQWDWLMADLETSAATYVLDTSPSGLHRWQHFPPSRFPPLRRLLRERYEELPFTGRVRIYRRRGCASAAAVPPNAVLGSAP